MAWLIGVGLVGLVVLFAWALYVAVERGDEQADPLHEEEEAFHHRYRLHKGDDDEEVR